MKRQPFATFVLFSLSIAASVLLQIGCSEKNPFEFEPQIVVFSLFIAGHRSPPIKLDRSWGIDSELPEEGLGVSDAEVMVTADGDTIHYVPVAGEPGLWVPWRSADVRPLKSYRLWVDAEGQQIYGETTVPDTFRIVQPAQGDTLYRDSTPVLMWRKSQGAAGYLIDIWSVIDTTHITLAVGALDTIFPILPFFLGDPGEYDLHVAALDSNYYDHVMMAGSPGVTVGPSGSGGDEESRLGGALGVFGSCAVDSVQVHVR